MNIVALATVAVILCGALASPAVLVWAIAHLRRSEDRTEGGVVLGAGVAVATALVVAKGWIAPATSRGFIPDPGPMAIAAAFTIGGIFGKLLHRLAFGRHLGPGRE